MRLDRWLWAARFFKTRGLAQAAVAGGKVKLEGERVKPAREVAPGARLTIRIGEFERNEPRFAALQCRSNGLSACRLTR